MKKIVILYGGRSGEHEVSLVSAASILRHLDLERFEPILVGAAKNGEWYLQPALVIERAFASDGPLSIEKGVSVFAAPGRGLAVESANGCERLDCDLVFPVLHGSFGEDGTIQGLLEVAGLAYVGAGVLGSALGMDKEKAKELWLGAGLPVVPFLALRPEVLRDMETLGEHSALARKVGGRFGWPCFVKPCSGGSSVGASKVASAGELEGALRAAFEWDEKVLVEPFVVAREIECAVLGNADPVAFEPGEVVPTHEFYDYEAKYVDPNGARLEVPAHIGPDQAERVKSVALAAFKVCELSGMARVDFFIDKRTGEVLLNELNTIPGFTHISMYPRMCQASGLSYSSLITRLAELALERQAIRAKLKFER